ncbi:hypothetical protein EV652_10619 [Kribbella steppae]|uniref:Uncharacterized protein n=1 Tax=Kribbella steppae TaxID=2512223 RepID=A0A4R2HGE5_9ACTN|nr:hypothetical protein EV652_10619 [Kribbella steppae]
MFQQKVTWRVLLFGLPLLTGAVITRGRDPVIDGR